MNEIEVSEENVGDYRLDVLRATNDAHMMFII